MSVLNPNGVKRLPAEVAVARTGTDKIKATGMALRELIVQAWEEEWWSALGYDSWDDYCAQEFGGLDLELPRDERREIVVSLRKSGMSLRAIASATGVPETTVRRDISSGAPLSKQNGAPELEVIDADVDDMPDWYCEGGGHPVSALVPSEQVGSRLCCPQCADEWRQPIKGRDGKNYPAPKPPTPPAAPKPRTMLTLFTHDGKPVEYPQPQSKPTFNNTAGDGISWASWSWNPVTGCLHGCNYCYARDIATRFVDAYPAGFTPLFHHERLDAPVNTIIPAQYRDDDHQSCGDGDCQICAYRRVFVCSMADLYGRWVPDEWIEKVHASMLRSPQWQYILLTKFPSRYVGLDLPDGAWVGTSVDEQKRVRIAQDAFSKLPQDGKIIKWLSLEPLREPLEFDDLSMFDWVVIGAQTATRQPDGYVPALSPPFDWVRNIYDKAREAGCDVHFKPNLTNGQPGMRGPNEYPGGR